jgi:signal transduction histidine kinase
VGLLVPGGVALPRFQAVVAVDESAVRQAWQKLLPRLFMAGGLSFLASVVVASLLARSISRPLRQITAASEEIARGRYDQQIPSYGGEEVGRLARAFNDMALQVSRSHRTLRDFIANASHELKTPLTSIQGFSQAMVDGTLSTRDDFAEAGKIINEEAVRMRGLVDDLLYLSQAEAGQVVLHPDRVDPLELMTETRERFRRKAERAAVRLVLEGAETPDVKADPRRLEQVLANIVDNALRHTPAGGTVSMSSSTDNGHVSLAVHNTGSFIAPDVIPRVFDRFFQVDPVRSRADGNTGLGLAISKEIVEAHGGNISVKSSETGGTEFVIILPAASEQYDDGI